MLYREIIAVCSQIHTKHINTLCGQNVELLNVKLAVHIVIIRLKEVKKNLRPPECRCVFSHYTTYDCTAIYQYKLYIPPKYNNIRIRLRMVFFTHRPKGEAPKSLSLLSPGRLNFVRWRLVLFAQSYQFLSFRTELCVSSYLPSRKRQITLSVKGHSVNTRPEYGNFFFLPVWRL